MANYTGSGSGSNTPSGLISIIRLLRYLANQTVNNLTSAGTAVSRVGQNLLTRTYSGALSYAGSTRGVFVLFQNVYSGVLSSAATLTRRINNLTRTMSGVITPVGTLTRAINLLTRTYSSVFNPAGSVVGRKETGITYKDIYGAITSVGVITRALVNRINRLANSGVITVIGIQKYLANQVSNLLTFTGTVTGSLGEGSAYDTFREGYGYYVGAIRRLIQITRTYSGSLSLAGAISYLVAGVAQQFTKTISGVISSVGSIIEVTITSNYLYIKNRTVASSGSLSKRLWNRVRTREGSVSFYKYLTYALPGTVVVNYYRTYAGALSFVGAIGNILMGWVKTVSGILASTGEALRNIVVTHTKEGILSLTGAYAYVYRATGTVLDEARSLARTLTITGRANWMVPRGTPAGALGMSGRISHGEMTIETLYYGIPNDVPDYRITVGATAPSNPNEGDLWVDTT